MTGEPRYLIAAAGVVVMIAAVCVGVARNETRRTDKAPVVSAETVSPVAPGRTRPVEYAPPVAESVPGDGYFVVGRDLKRGTYEGAGGLSCHWARVQGGPGATWYAESSQFQPGRQVVVLGGDDVFFASRGCGRWVMSR